MEKYTKTAGLNYLSENSYKGDGSPGMVMGIASDARGDTNTYEAKKPTTSSKHSTERELKKYDPAHGHTKPEGGNPQVCSCITSSGPSTDCSKCQGTGEIITPKRKDPKVDEALEDIMRLSGKERTDEGKMGEIHAAANELSKEEFAKEYPEWADEWESVRLGYDSGPEEGDTVHEADGSGSYGGQSPLTYDTQRSSKMKEEDDQIDEIAKLSGLGEERKRRPDADDYDDEDDWDSDEDEKPEDPDKDRVPHILMQVKKALDVEGDHDIQFENGDKHKFSVSDLNIFLTNYLDMKPEMREKMQEAAITGQEEFENIVSILSPKKK